MNGGEADDAARTRRRERRWFAALLAPVALALVVAGVLFGDEDDMLGVVGPAALAQGIGLAVALVWLAAGHNPLSRR
jgi:peptidoglycan/LPS O-acetylase OafA/YrhL